MNYARLSLAVFLACGLNSPSPATAYPIDCAILLCMPGGFPTSSPCLAAKAEVIRRIAKIPPEPPLQIWRCPMSTGVAVPGAGVDEGSYPETFQSSIALFRINKRTHNSSGGSDEYFSIMKYSYSGDYWGATDIPINTIPSWFTTEVRKHTGGSSWFSGYLLTWTDPQGQLGSSWLTF